jgi:hypothetical protein
MQVNSEQAVKSIIAYKSERRKQLAFEKKQFSKNAGNLKNVDSEILKKINHQNEVALTKKKLGEVKEKTQKQFDKWREDFRKIKRPSPKKKEGIVSVLAHHHHHSGGGAGEPVPLEPQQSITQAICFSSAIRCEGDLCQRETSQIFPRVRSSGEGGIIGNGVGEPTIVLNSLYFLFVPIANANIDIKAEVFLTGDITVNSSTNLNFLNFLLPFGKLNCSASAQLVLDLNVWQGNTITNTSRMLVADLNCENGSGDGRAFRNEEFILNGNAMVVAGMWIVIEVRATCYVKGISSCAEAVINFGRGEKGNGLDFGIRVPQLCVFLDSPIVNPL